MARKLRLHTKGPSIAWREAGASGAKPFARITGNDEPEGPCRSSMGKKLANRPKRRRSDWLGHELKKVGCKESHLAAAGDFGFGFEQEQTEGTENYLC